MDGRAIDRLSTAKIYQAEALAFHHEVIDCMHALVGDVKHANHGGALIPVNPFLEAACVLYLVSVVMNQDWAAS